MVAAIIVLAVAVLVLGAWLWASRSALAESEVRATELADRLGTAEREVEQKTAELVEARGRLDEERERATKAEGALATAEQRAEDAERAAADADAARSEAEARAEEAVAAAGEPLAPMALWALETVRVDRVWRDVVVAGTDQVSPLADTVDPARSAVEILAGSLREESGTSMEVIWKAEGVVPPTPGVLLVRAAEELLALARAADTGTLTVGNDSDGVWMSLACEPPVSAPAHLVAALDAAGLRPVTDGDTLTVHTAST